MFLVHFTLRRFIKSNVYIGHSIKHKVPSNFVYLLGFRNNMYIINLEYTLIYLRLALLFMLSLDSFKRQKIGFIGVNPFFSQYVKFAALKCNQFYFINKWINGFLSNFNELSFNRQVSRDLTNATRAPQVVFCLNLDKKTSILNECFKSKIPLISIVDSNINSSFVLYPIPGNDDALSSISLYCDIAYRTVRRNLSKETIRLRAKCLYLEKLGLDTFVKYLFMALRRRLFTFIIMYKRYKKFPFKLNNITLKYKDLLRCIIKFFLHKEVGVSAFFKYLNAFFFKFYSYLFDYKAYFTFKFVVKRLYSLYTSFLIKNARFLKQLDYIKKISRRFLRRRKKGFSQRNTKHHRTVKKSFVIGADRNIFKNKIKKKSKY